MTIQRQRAWAQGRMWNCSASPCNPTAHTAACLRGNVCPGSWVAQSLAGFSKWTKCHFLCQNLTWLYLKLVLIALISAPYFACNKRLQSWKFNLSSLPTCRKFLPWRSMFTSCQQYDVPPVVDLAQLIPSFRPYFVTICVALSCEQRTLSDVKLISFVG